jgi:hypothetical protein
MAIDYKTLSTSDLAKKMGTDPAIRAELEARGAIKNNQLQQGWQSIAPRVTASPQFTVQAPTVAPTMPQYQAPDYSAQFKSLADAQKQARINELQNAYQKSLGQTQVEQQNLQRQFEQGVGQTRTQSTLDARKFEDFLRTRGLAQSGVASQGAIAQNVALQGNLGRLEGQRLLGEQDISRRQSQLLSDLEFGKAQASSQADQAMMQNLLQAQQQADTRNYNQYLSAQDRALQERQLADNRAYQESQQQASLGRAEADRARQMELDTIGQYQGDYQAEINRRQATPDTADDWLIPYLQQARQQKIQSQGLDQQGRPLPQAPVAPTIPTVTSSTAMDLWKALGTANETVARVLGVPVGTRYQAPAKAPSKTTTPTKSWLDE